MNYEGRVTSVDTTVMSFQLDNNVIVHTGHIASNTNKIYLPEIGEFVKIYNAHFMISSTNKLEKLFVCDHGKIVCDHFTNIEDKMFMELIDEYNLGCSDLHAIDANISVLNDRLKGLAQNPVLEIMFEIVQESADLTKNKNLHKCINNVISPLTVKTVTDYNYTDLYPNKNEKVPLWFFGSHSKDCHDKLVGFLQLHKRYGILFLRDVNKALPCVLMNSSAKKFVGLVNKFVIIERFRVFTEIYREDQVPSIEYILFDVHDVRVLQSIRSRKNEYVHQLMMKELPENFPYVYNFKFKLLKKAMVNVNKQSQVECWLEILNVDTMQQIYLGLNSQQVPIIPLFKEGHIYEAYHSETLSKCVNIELERIKVQPTFKFLEKTAIFVHIANESSTEIFGVTELFEKNIKGLVSIQGLVTTKKLTPSLASRTKSVCTLKEFGTPGKYTHSVELEDDTNNTSITLYLNNWENLLVPLGLIPRMRICVKNVLFLKNYLKSTALTSFEVLSYEPLVFFDSANSNQSLERGCDKYSYLGWGDLVPSNVLVWGRVSVLYIRSLKIKFNCTGCRSDCTCSIDTTLTFYVHDEFGAALVLTKSMELLRLILDLEPEQWKIWCDAFRKVKDYVYSDLEIVQSENLYIKSFCELLTISIQTSNACKMSNLELKCRKIDSSSNDDNDRISLWFCIDARIKEWSD